ncbi:DUF3103 domain-containing protein [Fulvivirga ulvae]|uniref:DUF3103 family protein n=1 Tax=Fulvivirga ulvae TaxID=2904245 RepID=UPI001F2A8B88|nr:DUF3103 family protein [Fulvivirga ulvae]UII30232.1 DUF3103 domain-containing protein [Fulvivirga ulvae]
MMKKILSVLSIGLYLIVFTACEENEVTPDPVNQDQNPSLDAVAQNIADLLSEGESFDNFTAILEQQTVGIKLAEVLTRIDADSKEGSTFSNLKASAQFYDDQLKTNEAPEVVEIPEVWLYKPAGTNSVNRQDVLVAYPPAGKEDDWTKVKAYTLDKKVVYLDPNAEPDVPVIVVDNHGFEAFKVEVSYINKQLQQAGFQKKMISSNTKGRAAAAGLETTKLDKIRLNDDEEPWISGSAEVYAVTSGIRNSSNQAEVAVIPMYYLDKEDKDYYPNQVMLFWDDYAYQAANIQLFEKDDNHNYQDMVSMLVKELTALAGTLSGHTWITALGVIGAAIVDALPASFWTNDDDYVDSFYTIEKNRSYTNYYGARGNAKVNMSPYFIPAN